MTNERNGWKMKYGIEIILGFRVQVILQSTTINYKISIS